MQYIWSWTLHKAKKEKSIFIGGNRQLYPINDYHSSHIVSIFIFIFEIMSQKLKAWDVSASEYYRLTWRIVSSWTKMISFQNKWTNNKSSGDMTMLGSTKVCVLFGFHWHASHIVDKDKVEYAKSTEWISFLVFIYG